MRSALDDLQPWLQLRRNQKRSQTHQHSSFQLRQKENVSHLSLRPEKQKLLIIEYGGLTFQLVPLTATQNIQCIVIGATGLIWNVIVKVFVPDSFMNNFSLLREEKKEEIINVDSIFERW